MDFLNAKLFEKYTRRAYNDERINPTTLKVYLTLLFLCERTGNIICSKRYIAEKSNVADGGIGPHLDILEQGHYIFIKTLTHGHATTQIFICDEEGNYEEPKKNAQIIRRGKDLYILESEADLVQPDTEQALINRKKKI